MKTVIAPVVLALVAGVAVPSAFAETASYSFSNFHSVQAGAGVNVVLKQGPFSITAEGSEKALKRLDISQDGDTLTVTHQKVGWTFGSFHGATVTVTAPSFSQLPAGAGSDMIGNDLTFTDLQARTSGGADMTRSGRCKSLDIESSGGADFHGGKLKCESVTVRTSGGADAVVNASTSAEARASGGSDIRILGAPAAVEKNASGGADISVS